jgi:hypothetical protein
MKILTKFLSILTLASSVSLLAIGCSNDTESEQQSIITEDTPDSEWIEVEYIQEDFLNSPIIYDGVNVPYWKIDFVNQLIVIQSQDELDSYYVMKPLWVEDKYGNGFWYDDTGAVLEPNTSVVAVCFYDLTVNTDYFASQMRVYKNDSGVFKVCVDIITQDEYELSGRLFTGLLPAIPDDAEVRLEITVDGEPYVLAE